MSRQHAAGGYLRVPYGGTDGLASRVHEEPRAEANEGPVRRVEVAPGVACGSAARRNVVGESWKRF